MIRIGSKLRVTSSNIKKRRWLHEVSDSGEFEVIATTKKDEGDKDNEYIRITKAGGGKECLWIPLNSNEYQLQEIQ